MYNPFDGLFTLFEVSDQLARLKHRLVMELDEVNVFASTMFRGLKQIRDPRKAGRSGKRGRDVIEVDLMQLIDDDVPLFQCVSIAHFDVGTFPDANAGGDLTAFDGFTQSFSE
jgi:hypothetical protein